MNDSKINAIVQFKQMLEELKINYIWNEENTIFTFEAESSDLPIEINTTFTSAGQMLMCSLVPLRIKQDKIVETTLLVNSINQNRVMGFLDFDMNEGILIFRISINYFKVKNSSSVIISLIQILVDFVDYYNDKFLLFNNEVINFDEFMQFVREENS